MFEKKYRVIVPAFGRCRILLIGCGGTGSFIAQNLARLAYHMKSEGKTFQVGLIDPDTVTEENVGRQNFCPADIGKNKAEVLCARYNLAYGLKFGYSNSLFQAQAPIDYSDTYRTLGIIIGAVDTAATRKSIDEFVRRQPRDYWWVDCGNEEWSGQVLVGNKWLKQDLGEALNPMGLCEGLPLPSVQHPELLDTNRDMSSSRPSCAARLSDNQQGLFVNQTAASFASSMLYQMIVKQELNHYAVYFDLARGISRSMSITERNLAQYCRQPKAKVTKGFPALVAAN